MATSSVMRNSTGGTSGGCYPTGASATPASDAGREGRRQAQARPGLARRGHRAARDRGELGDAIDELGVGGEPRAARIKPEVVLQAGAHVAAAEDRDRVHGQLE